MRSALPRRINIAIVTLRYTRNKQPTTLSETGATAAATPQDDRPRRLPRCSARRRRARGPSPPARGQAPVALRLPLPPPPRRRRRRGGLRRRERRRGSDLARAGAVAAAGGATQPPPAAGEWVLRPALPSLLPQARAGPPWEHSLRRLRGDESGMGRGQLRHPVLPAVLRPPPGSGGKCELPFAPCGGFLVVPPFLSVCCAGTQPSPIAQLRLLQRLTPPPPPFSFSAFLASPSLPSSRLQNSVVRSIAMDSWSHTQVLSMLEGGNDQLSAFFVRHSLSPGSAPGGTGNGSAPPPAAHPVVRSESSGSVDEVVVKRYRTKAALFYRQNLAKHVDRVASEGEYRGREASRKRTNSRRSSPAPSPAKREPVSSPTRPRIEKEQVPGSGGMKPPRPTP